MSETPSSSQPASGARSAVDVEKYLNDQVSKPTLRFLTCGSVDDGKSTLIGRLLFDSKLIFEDQLSALEADSRKMGTQGGEIDLALLVDGLAAEREQGITIDVAYRFFSTDKRKFVVADTPGHEQYTRNMATGASSAELAVILIDARKGVLTQTRRHSYIVSLLGIKHVVLAVNKMDLVDHDQATFDKIVADYQDFLKQLSVEGQSINMTSIPVSALTGANVMSKSPEMAWYEGPTLLEHLETVEVTGKLDKQAFRMPVQWVNRPNLDFRGFSGTIASGTVTVGDEIVVAPAGAKSKIARIVTHDGDIDSAGPGYAVTLVLADEIDASRGDVLAAVEQPPPTADQFGAHIVWMQDEPLYPGRQYYLKTGTRTVTCSVTDLRHTVNVNTLEHQAAKELQLNEIGVGNIAIDQPIAFEPYAVNRNLGSFVLIDRQTYRTVGAGMLDFALRRSGNVPWQSLTVDAGRRADMKNQKAGVIWLTGLPSAGKSTIASLLESRLHDQHLHTYVLDGDNLRHGISRDLGFTEADRVQNIRRVGEVAKLMADAGLITIVAVISPYAAERRAVKDKIGANFFEIFVDAPIGVCKQRDPKGLFAKADNHEIENLTGVDSDYQAPENPDLVLPTSDETPEQSVERLMTMLQERGFVTRR